MLPSRFGEFCKLWFDSLHPPPPLPCWSFLLLFLLPNIVIWQAFSYGTSNKLRKMGETFQTDAAWWWWTGQGDKGVYVVVFAKSQTSQQANLSLWVPKSPLWTPLLVQHYFTRGRGLICWVIAVALIFVGHLIYSWSHGDQMNGLGPVSFWIGNISANCLQLS